MGYLAILLLDDDPDEEDSADSHDFCHSNFCLVSPYSCSVVFDVPDTNAPATGTQKFMITRSCVVLGVGDIYESEL